MGVSTNGQICFGILLEDGVELPWEQEEGGQDIDDWWRNQTGYVATDRLYDEDGDRLPGVTEERISAHYQEKREWDEAHLCPIEMVNVCSGDCPQYIVAIPSTVKSARRGYPQVISPDADFIVSEEAIRTLVEFATKWQLEPSGDGVPRWYLSSLWS